MDSNSDKVYVKEFTSATNFFKENHSVDAFMFTNKDILSVKGIQMLLNFDSVKFLFFKISKDMNYRFFDKRYNCVLLEEDFFAILKRETGFNVYYKLIKDNYYVSVTKNSN
jgi:hypothetical protein